MACGNCLDAMDAGGNGVSVAGVNVRGAPSSVGGDGVGVASGVGKAASAASTSASACTGSKARVRPNVAAKIGGPPNASACLFCLSTFFREVMISIFGNG